MKNKTTTTKPFDGSGHNRLHHINHYDDHDDILKLKLKFNKYKMATTTTIHPHNQCIRFISSSSSSTTTIFITDDDAKHQQNQNLNHFHHYCHNCSQYTNHCHQCRKVKSKNSYHHHHQHLSSQHNQYLPLIYWTLFIITIIFNPLSATSTTANMTSSIRRSGMFVCVFISFIIKNFSNIFCFWDIILINIDDI